MTTFPDKIMRFDGNKAVGEKGWQTYVTPLQMLEEILRSCANANISCDEIGCTVGYAPGDTDEEWVRQIEFWKSRGHDEPGFPRRMGKHHVSLWERVEDPENPDQMINHIHTSFIFQTDPPDDFWNGI